MNQNLEIEFKNELTENEYARLLELVIGDSFDIKHMIFQNNYYFDTLDEVLKNQGSVLRIRETESYNELTFKVPAQGFVMETNWYLSYDDVSKVIEQEQMQLTSFVLPTDDLPNLKNISMDTVFHLFNSFQTKRFEKRFDDYLIVIDKTTFQNGQVDYELEIECLDAEVGQLFFECFLVKYGITKKPSLPKIARAEKNKKNL